MKPLEFLKNIHNRSVSAQAASLLDEICDAAMALRHDESSSEECEMRILSAAGRIAGIIRSEVYDGEVIQGAQKRLADAVADGIEQPKK